MGKGRILLVGGDPDITRSLQVYLEAHGLLVQSVKRGDEGLSVCRQTPPDAVIFSWHLSDMSGDHLCQQIRDEEGMADSFVLALLPVNERNTKLAALEAGADDVATAPLDIEGIRLKIEQVLRH